MKIAVFVVVALLCDASASAVHAAQQSDGSGSSSGDPTPSPLNTDEQNINMCTRFCKDSGFCCNDHTIGSNQMLSCSQACMIRARGTPVTQCVILCDRTGNSGCSLDVNDRTYTMCGVCTDFKPQCPNGVMVSSDCMTGCTMSTPAPLTLAPPTPATPTPTPTNNTVTPNRTVTPTSTPTNAPSQPTETPAPTAAASQSVCPVGSVGKSTCTPCTVKKDCSDHAINVTDDGKREACTCLCKPGFTTSHCSTCLSTHFLSSEGTACTACTTADWCTGTGVATQLSAQSCECQCGKKYSGSRCEECKTAGNYVGTAPDCVLCETSVHCSGHASSATAKNGVCICECNAGYAGTTCDQCITNAPYVKDASPLQCTLCTISKNCQGRADVVSLLNNQCNCQCKPIFDGATCNVCSNANSKNPYPTCTTCDGAYCSNKGTALAGAGSSCSCTCNTGFLQA